MSSSILQKYRTEILDLAMRHGARDVRVFGSLARGEGTEGSNLDLLVTLEEGRSLLDLVGLKQDLEDLVHHPVNVVTEKALSLTCESMSSPKWFRLSASSRKRSRPIWNSRPPERRPEVGKASLGRRGGKRWSRLTPL